MQRWRSSNKELIRAHTFIAVQNHAVNLLLTFPAQQRQSPASMSKLRFSHTTQINACFDSVASSISCQAVPFGSKYCPCRRMPSQGLKMLVFSRISAPKVTSPARTPAAKDKEESCFRYVFSCSFRCFYGFRDHGILLVIAFPNEVFVHNDKPAMTYNYNGDGNIVTVSDLGKLPLPRPLKAEAFKGRFYNKRRGGD